MPSDFVIHPGVRHEIFGIALYTAVSQRERVILPPDLVIKYEIGAENARLKSGQLTVSGPDVAWALVHSRPENRCVVGSIPTLAT